MSFFSVLVLWIIHQYGCKASEEYNGTTLSVNQQYVGYINEGELAYYRLNVTSHKSELHIYVTPIGNCDPDLFVSWSGHPFPTTPQQIDASSRNAGAEWLIIKKNDFISQQYVYITVQGWTAGRYTILYRFMENAQKNNFNPFQIGDNVPQFFIIDNDLENDAQKYAMIDYKININPEISNTNKISFYLDSYISNTVFFECWIFINYPPPQWPYTDDANVLYRHLDPTISSLRISANDKKAIQCTLNITTNNTKCSGYDAAGNLKSVTMDKNHENHIYFTVYVDTSKSDIKHSELQIVMNDEPLIDNTNTNIVTNNCTDCGPNGQSPKEQLSLFTGETSWNALMGDENGIVRPEFFRYEYNDNNPCDIQIKVADITGFTNIYLSNKSLTAWPSNTTYILKSTDSNTQTITINNAQTDTYHIGVYPASMSTQSKEVLFTITLSVECDNKDDEHYKIIWTEIDSGIPVPGNTAVESFDYYTYTVPTSVIDIVISISKDFGDIDIYITPNPNISHIITPNSNTAKWKDTSSSNDSTVSTIINIPRTDPNTCNIYPCTYAITVHCGAYYSGSQTIDQSLGCQYTIIVSSTNSITKLQSSQPLNDILHKNGAPTYHVYEYDYYALPQQQQDDITISITPIHWNHNDNKDVNIYVSTVYPDLYNEANDVNIWNFTAIASNSLYINKSAITTDDKLFIVVDLSHEYRANNDETEQFEYSIMVYTTQTVKLLLDTPLMRTLLPGVSITFQAFIDVGKDFSVFIASTNNVTGNLYVTNMYNNNDAPNHDDATSYEWNTRISSEAAANYVAQTTINYQEDPKSCQSVKTLGSNSNIMASNEPRLANIANYRCSYWITVYNPNNLTLECVILGTEMFHQLSNGKSIKSLITADDIEYTKRFVLNPQIMPFITSERRYNLVVSASMIIGDVMGLYIGSTPFANDLYSQLEARSHDFAIGRDIPIDRSYYVAVVAYPGDLFTLTATFMDVTDVDTITTTSSFLESGTTQLSILDTKEQLTNHQCHVYIHNGTSSSVQFTYTSVIGGDKAIILVKHVGGNGVSEVDLNCDNIESYPSVNVIEDIDLLTDEIGILFGPRDNIQYDNMNNGDYLYINIYPLEDLERIDEITGYYMEYRLLAYCLSDSITLFNGIPVNIDVAQNVPIYAQIPITKKMFNAMDHINHFLDISFTKYSSGKPEIYISSLFKKPNRTHSDYILSEDDRNDYYDDTDLYFDGAIDTDSDTDTDIVDTTEKPQKVLKTLGTYGITIDYHSIAWPLDNNPWSLEDSTTNHTSYDWWFFDPNAEIRDYNWYDDDFEIDEWIGYLYLTINCIDGGNAVIDLTSNYKETHIVSNLLYGVPMYSEITEQDTMKYFILDVGDTNLLIDDGNDEKDNNDSAVYGTLQISLSIISGSAELYIDGTGKNFPEREKNNTYTQTTLDIQDGDINSFKVIDIDLASIVSKTSQEIIIGVESTSQMTKFTITAQKINVAPTLLTINNAINAELSASTPYAIFDFEVDLKNIGTSDGSMYDFRIIANEMSGKIGLFVNSPDKYPDIPTEAKDATYHSAELQLAVQIVHVTHRDLISLKSSNNYRTIRSRYIYRCVVGLIDKKTNARFSIIISQKINGVIPTQTISDGQPVTYILDSNQKQLFKYEESKNNVKDLTITLSSIFGDPSMYIGFNKIPDSSNHATYNWSTPSWGPDSIQIQNAISGIYNILVNSGTEMSTQFTLTVASSEIQHVITNGISLFETIYGIDTKYYVFYPSINNNQTSSSLTNIFISIVSYSGDIDIFISSNGRYKHPNSTYYDHSFQINHIDAMKSESLSIANDATTNICNFTSFKCHPIYIAIQANMSDNINNINTSKITYSIQVTQNILGILSDGVSVQSKLTTSTNQKLFRFTIDKTAVHTVMITISSLKSNPDVSMFIYPTGTIYNTTGNITKQMFGVSQTAILKDRNNSNSNYFCLNSQSNADIDTSYTYNPNLCVYLIVVQYNKEEMAEPFAFNIIASSDKTFVTLQDGVEITDTITSPGSFRYYNFYVNSIKDIGRFVLEVDVNPYYGDPDLYIAKDLKNNKLVNTTNNWQWRSMRFGEDDIAILIKNASNLGVYQIGVYSYSITKYRLTGWLRQIVYNLNETDDKQAITMYPGQPRFDYSVGDIRCYVFNTDNNNHPNEEIEVTLNVHRGTINVYINFDTIMAPNNIDDQDWNISKLDIAETAKTPKVIPISPNKLHGISKIYACVQGNDGLKSLYEISIDYITGLKTLSINGKPMINTVSYYKYDYFDLDVIDTSMGIYINVESLTDGVTAPYVYISRINRHPSPNDTRCDGEIALNAYQSTCTMTYTDESDDKLRVILLNNIYSVGSYYISITPDPEHYNNTNNNEIITKYQIICSSTLSQIEIGQTMTDILIESNWKYYGYEMTETSSIPLFFTFTLLSGSTTTYISSTNSINNYDEINDKTRIIIDNGTDNKTAIGGFRGSYSIQISETVNSYFYCKKESFLDDIEEFIELELDSFDTYRAIPMDTNLCKYYIAVYASIDSQYTINVHFENDLNKLKNDGTPITGHLTAYNYTYYYVLLTMETDKLQILLTDMDSNIDNDLIMYINIDEDNDLSNNADDYSRPNGQDGNYRYKSSNGSIIFNDAKAGTYYISIYAAKDGDHYYSILATTQRIVLIENYPQILSTPYLQLKQIKYPLAGYYFSYNVLKHDNNNYNTLRSIEFDIHSSTNNNDLFTVFVTNSETMTDCDVTTNCPNSLLCEENTARCARFDDINVNNPVIIETNNRLHCKYNGNSKLCTYYIGIILNEGYENKVGDLDTLQFDITAHSSDASSGVVMYDGASIISSFKTSKTEYNYYTSYIPEHTDEAEITLQTCSGDTDLYISLYNVFPTKLSAQYRSENEDKIEVTQISDLHIQTAQQTQKVIYIGVRNNKHDNNHDSEYQLNVGYEVDQYRAIIDNEDLKVSSLNRGEVQIIFDLKTIPDDIDQEVVKNGLLDLHKITINGYKLYFADSSNPYTMYSQCGLNRMEKWDKCHLQSNETKSCFIDLGNPSNHSFKQYMINNDKSYKRIIHGLQPNLTYFFNILLEIKVENIGDNENNDKILYKTYFVQNEQILSKFVINNGYNADITALEIAFGITIPIIFILIALVYYYYKKHKRVERDLSVLEMEEVPINKVVKAIGGTKFSKYSLGNDNKISSKFSAAIKERKKKKQQKSREKAKKYHSLLSAHDDDGLSGSDDDDDLSDSMVLEIDDEDDNDKNVVS